MCNPGDSETSRTGKLMASLTICHSTSSGTSGVANGFTRSEEHTSELQSRLHLVCRLLLEKKENTDGLQLWVRLNDRLLIHRINSMKQNGRPGFLQTSGLEDVPSISAHRNFSRLTPPDSEV